MNRRNLHGISAAIAVTVAVALVPPLLASDLVQTEGASKHKPSRGIAAYYSRLTTVRMALIAETLVKSGSGQRVGEREELDVAIDLGTNSFRDYRARFNIRGIGNIEGQERVYTPSSYFSVIIDPKTGEAKAGASSFRIDDKDRLSQLSNMYFSVLVGYLPLTSEQSVVALLNSEDMLRPIEGGEDSLVLMQGNRAGLKFEIWVDPTLEYLPKRIRLRSQTKAMKFSSYEYYVRATSEFGGIVFPSSLTILTEESDEDGRTYSLTRNVEVKNFCIDLLGPEDFTLKTKIPDGLRILMRDAPHLEQRWHQGKLSPSVPHSIVVNGNTFGTGTSTLSTPSTSSTRAWFVCFNFLVMVILAFLLVRRRVTKRTH
ncbi:MAG: hypothetical protein IT425_11995 [Pirellulales bacterium]|nr:hypothetical protein [Pirellulales bacterium]